MGRQYTRHVGPGVARRLAGRGRRPYNEDRMDSASPHEHLLAVPLEAFEALCRKEGQPVYRACQVFEWIHRKGVLDFLRMSNLPRDLRDTWSRRWSIRTARELSRRVARDGTIKLLLRWPDGATSECVLLSDGRRRTACISSQVGCPVGCAFCASGLTGLQRQLTAGEIVEQVLWIRALAETGGKTPEQVDDDGQAASDSARVAPARLSHVVFMGLGEPLANYNNVIRAIRILNADWGPNLAARHITISTVGLPGPIKRLADEKLQVNLALSLHAPTDALRAELIPWAQRVRLDALVESARAYFERTGREVTVEYLLLAGVNDQPEHAHQLVKLCRRMRCNVNLIRYNPVAGLPYERPTSYAAHRFLERLRERGINAHIRRSRGLDIEAACGQLRRHVAAGTDKIRV